MAELNHLKWAREELGRAQVGDTRRTLRLVKMAAQALRAPSGKISEVFAKDKERQGAYDLLESGHVAVEALTRALGEASAARAAQEQFAFVAIDGSSVALRDVHRIKDFGSIGTLKECGRGLKVMSAFGVSPEGVPLGVFTQVWWARTEAKSGTSAERRRRAKQRKVTEKETHRWLEAIDQSCAHAQTSGAALWFELDREADSSSVLFRLNESGHRFTVRSSWDRLLETTGKDRQYLRQWLTREAPGGSYLLTVPAGSKRRARTAHMVMRWSRVTLCLRDQRGHNPRPLEVRAVWAREEGTNPADEKPIDWLLLTNTSVDSFEQARFVIFGYTQRWRIEEFYKTWKTGACDVERTQLRTQHAVTIWATILAAVAARIERLKFLARTTPEQPASVELTPHEIRALILLKREIKKRTEMIPDDMPSIARATLWLAELGGYTGKSSGGPPGSITIRRGLERLRPAALLLVALERDRK